MKCSSIIYATVALISIVALSSFQSANAQCKRFSKTRVLSTLDARAQLLHASSGRMMQGEQAAVVIDAPQGLVRLDLVTHESLGVVHYVVTNRMGDEITRGAVRAGRASIDLEVLQQQSLTFSVEIPEGISPYTTIGCVGLAATRANIIDLTPASEAIADVKVVNAP
jgi:hypothetical protein